MNQNNFSQINLNQNDLTQEDSHQVIPLDTASTVDSACNPKPGDQVERSMIKMKLNTDAGNEVMTERINMPAHDKMWFAKQLQTHLHSTI